MSSEEELREAFRFFDSDGDGLVGKGDLKNSMEILGESLSEKKLSNYWGICDWMKWNFLILKCFLGEMISEGDSDGDGFLNERGK